MSVVDHWVEGEDEQEIDQKKNIHIYIQIQKIMIQFVQTPFNVFDAVLYLEYAKDVGELGGGGEGKGNGNGMLIFVRLFALYIEIVHSF